MSSSDRHSPDRPGGPGRPEDRDFRRYRDRGDARALARVFDRVAPKLLLVAAHLSRDAAEAEDLVQATFLDAMRDAARYDAERSVTAWMTSILRHRAIDQRRRAALRRTVDGSQHEHLAGPEREPSDELEANELMAQVTRAIEALEDPYREVAVLNLVHGLPPTAIAHALGRAPGTVRMQLKRALERLRGRIPDPVRLAGLALGPARGLPAVREAIAAQADQLAAPAGPASLATHLTTIAGGWTTMKLALSLITVAALAWALFELNARPVPAGAPVAAAGAPALLDRAFDREPPQLQLGATRAASDPSAALAAPVEPRSATAVRSLDVVVHFEHDGTPAAGVHVYRRAESARGVPAPLGTVRVSDASGLARFGTWDGAPCELLVDRTGTRFQVGPDTPLPVRVTIPAGVQLAGRVLALDGTPVPAAQVLALRPDHHDRLLAVAVADERGAFAIREVEPGTELLASAPGHQRSELESVRGLVGTDESITLTMGARGHRLSGRVTTADGAPVPHAMLAIGVDEDAREQATGSTRQPVDAERKALDLEALLVRADEEGRFSTREVPAGHLTVVARDPAHPELVGWTSGWMTFESSLVLNLSLEPGAAVTGTVRRAGGRPAGGLWVSNEWDGSARLGQFEDTLGRLFGDQQVRTDAEGRYALVGLLPGEHDLEVLSERDTLARSDREVIAGARLEWNPVVAGASLFVRALGPDDRPLAGWSLSVDDSPDRLRQRESDPVTGPDGRATVAGLERDRTYAIALRAPSSGLEVTRRTELTPSDREVVIRITAAERPSAGLRGRWLNAAGAPLARAELSLERDGLRRALPALTDAEGRFEYDALTPGRWRLTSHDDRYPHRTRLAEVALEPEQVVDVGSVWLPDADAYLEVELAGGEDIDRVELTLAPDPPRAGESPGPSGRVDHSAIRRFSADGSGQWRSPRLFPGPYTLFVGGGRAASRAYSFEAVPGINRVRVEYGPGVGIEFELLLDPIEGRRVDQRVHVLVRTEAGHAVYDSSRQVGTRWRYARDPAEGAGFQVSLTPGAYIAEAALLDGSRRAETSFTVAVEAPADRASPVLLDLRSR